MSKLLILQEIDTLPEKNLECLKTHLKNNGHENLAYKEEEDIILIKNITKNRNKFTDLEKQCKNIILTKDLELINYYFNDIIHNPEEIKIDLSTTIIQESIEGTTIVCFYHNDKWYISTRSCIDAEKSNWVPNYSYKILFEEIICLDILDHPEEDKLRRMNEFYNVLDKTLCYFFVLVHPFNLNIIRTDNKKLIHYMTRKKGFIEEVEIKTDLYNFSNIEKSEEIKDCTYETLISNLERMNVDNNESVVKEGYVIRYYENNECHVIKLQTNKYKNIKEIKPNHYNEFMNYIELYKEDKLKNYLDLNLEISNMDKGKIVNNISFSLKMLSNEIYMLYFNTRKMNNKEIYDNLTYIYKKTLYLIHGIHLDTKNKININNVYTILKTELSTQELCKLLLDRKDMINKRYRIFTKYNRYISHITNKIEN